MSDSAYEERITQAILLEKEKHFGAGRYYSPLNDGVYLVPVTIDACDDELVATLARWRSENQYGFIKIFKVTFQGTRAWLEYSVQQRKDRLLFLVFDCHERAIGHLGVSSFDFDGETCEIDNVVRGVVSKQKSVMYSASKTLLKWIEEVIKPRNIYLRVLNDNVRALLLYHRLGFVPCELEGLEKIESDDGVEWIPATQGVVGRFFIKMSFKGK